MNRIIQVKVKNVYGQKLIYPVCPNAKRFCELTNTKTLTINSLRIIGKLGFDIVARDTSSNYLNRELNTPDDDRSMITLINK